MKKAFILLLLVLSFIGAKANDGVFYAQGNHLIPITETDISVKKEILTIQRVDEHLEVTVYYEFFNPAKAKDLLVGFEASAPYPYDEAYMQLFPEQPHMRNFKVVVNGEPLKYQIALVSAGVYDAELEDWVGPEYYVNGKMQSWSRQQCEDSLKAHDYFDYPFNFVYHFNAHFREGLNIVQHTYDYDLSSSVGEEYNFPYVLTAANRWANHRIDDFTLNIDMGERESFFMDQSFFSSVDEWTIKGKGRVTPSGKWERQSEPMFHVQRGSISFHKDNFHPDGELNISKPIVLYLLPCGFAGCGATEILDLVRQTMCDLAPLKDNDLKDELNADQRRIMKNIPFAYRGRVFKNEKLRRFFESTDWYVPDPDYVDDMSTMSETERGWIYYWSE